MDRWSIAGIFTGIGSSIAGLFCIIKSMMERNALLSHFGNTAPSAAIFTAEYLLKIGRFLFFISSAWILILLCIEWGAKVFSRKRIR